MLWKGNLVEAFLYPPEFNRFLAFLEELALKGKDWRFQVQVLEEFMLQ
jgi:hypothetical protein